MGGGLEDIMDRRDFLRGSALAVASLPFARFAWAGETDKTSLQKLEEILDMDVEVKDWKPIDVTDEIKAALESKDALLFEPSSIACVSPNRKWWFSHIIPGRGNIDYYTQKLFGNKYQSTFLFDSVAKKVYTLLYGDDKLAGFPSADFTKFGNPHRIADNGVAIYGVTWPWPKKEEGTALDAVVIADYKNSRKIVVKAKEARRVYWPDIDISKGGNRAVLQDQSGFHILEIENLHIIYSGKDHCGGMNDDASVIAYQRVNEHEYRRRELKTGEDNLMWRRDRTRWGFKFSPDGNFCTCILEDFGPSYLNVYVHPTKERFAIRFAIDSLTRFNSPSTIDNDGTLNTWWTDRQTYKQTYKYKDGSYHWATEGKPQPEGLRIIKK